MFYYLLDKSSFLKNQDPKTKQTSILIYGTIIYIILHLILNSINKTMIQYFWFILGMDITVILLNTKITTDLIFNKPNKSNIKKVRFNEEVMERKIEPISEEIDLKEFTENDTDIIKEIVNKDKVNRKKNSNKKNSRKSTPISDILNKEENKINNPKINNQKIDSPKINDPLDEIKMEDLVSDSGSDIDLESFEKEYFESKN